MFVANSIRDPWVRFHLTHHRVPEYGQRSLRRGECVGPGDAVADEADYKVEWPGVLRDPVGGRESFLVE